MSDPNSQLYEEAYVLTKIAEKTRRNAAVHHGKQIFYILVEMFCYLAFLLVFAFAFYLPSELFSSAYRNKDLGELLLLVKISSVLFSLFPLAVGLLVRRIRQKNKTLNEIYILVNQRVLKMYK